MIEDFDNYVRKIWEQKKTPLEKMYDSWMGQGNWEPDQPQTRYAIYSWDDIVWRGRFIQAGQRFPCHLCGATDRWVPEGDRVLGYIRVFVCEHEPIQIVRGGIRQISSVSVRLVSHYEETYRPD
jgi:hypothetical protein